MVMPRVNVRGRRWLWPVGGVLAAAACAWTALAFHRPGHVAVTTATVTSGPIVRRIVATGTLQPVATVQVGAQVSGTIQALFADYNSIVHRGQILAKLDPALFEAALGEMEAALGQAQAALEAARANKAGFETAAVDAQMKLTRAEALAARQLIPQSDLDAARIAMNQADADRHAGDAQIVAAQAAIEQTRAQVGQAKVNLDHTVITSPIDGIVVSRSVDLGQTVAAAVQAPVLFTIAADFTRMQVEVDIDEADVGGVEPGTPARFEVESYPGDEFNGTIEQVRLQPVAEQTTTATTAGAPNASTTSVAAVVGYATIIGVSNPDEKLRPGMTATVILTGARIASAVRIPNSALSFRPPPKVLAAIGQSIDAPPSPTPAAGDATARRVWRFDGTRFTPVDVRAGLTDGQWTELVDGSLRDGDTLVTSASIGEAPAR